MLAPANIPEILCLYSNSRPLRSSEKLRLAVLWSRSAHKGVCAFVVAAAPKLWTSLLLSIKCTHTTDGVTHGWRHICFLWPLTTIFVFFWTLLNIHTTYLMLSVYMMFNPFTCTIFWNALAFCTARWPTLVVLNVLYRYILIWFDFHFNLKPFSLIRSFHGWLNEHHNLLSSFETTSEVFVWDSTRVPLWCWVSTFLQLAIFAPHFLQICLYTKECREIVSVGFTIDEVWMSQLCLCFC